MFFSTDAPPCPLLPLCPAEWFLIPSDLPPTPQNTPPLTPKETILFQETIELPKSPKSPKALLSSAIKAQTKTSDKDKPTIERLAETILTVRDSESEDFNFQDTFFEENGFVKPFPPPPAFTSTVLTSKSGLTLDLSPSDIPLAISSPQQPTFGSQHAIFSELIDEEEAEKPSIPTSPRASSRLRSLFDTSHNSQHSAASIQSASSAIPPTKKANSPSLLSTALETKYPRLKQSLSSAKEPSALLPTPMALVAIEQSPTSTAPSPSTKQKVNYQYLSVQDTLNICLNQKETFNKALHEKSDICVSEMLNMIIDTNKQKIFLSEKTLEIAIKCSSSLTLIERLIDQLGVSEDTFELACINCRMTIPFAQKLIGLKCEITQEVLNNTLKFQTDKAFIKWMASDIFSLDKKIDEALMGQDDEELILWLMDQGFQLTPKSLRLAEIHLCPPSVITKIKDSQSESFWDTNF